MIGKREIDVLLLPEMSGVERARRAKKSKRFPLSCPQAARRRQRAKPWLYWKGKVSALRDSAYILPAAFRDAATRAWESTSCSYPQAKLKLILKVMVGCGKRSIRASGGAGPGQDERRSRWMVVELSKC